MRAEAQKRRESAEGDGKREKKRRDKGGPGPGPGKEKILQKRENARKTIENCARLLYNEKESAGAERRDIKEVCAWQRKRSS